MRLIIGTNDRYLSENVYQIVSGFGFRAIRTAKADRIIDEMKRLERFCILDMKWEAIQDRETIKKIINLGRMCRNKTVIICPNRDEKLKKFAKQMGPAEVFLRYDLQLAFKEYIRTLRPPKD